VLKRNNTPLEAAVQLPYKV